MSPVSHPHAAETGFNVITGHPRLCGVPGGTGRHAAIMSNLVDFRRRRSLDNGNGWRGERDARIKSSAAGSDGSCERFLGGSVRTKPTYSAQY